MRRPSFNIRKSAWAFLVLCAALPLRAQEGLVAGAGVTNVADPSHRGAMVLEYHTDWGLWGLKPIAGFWAAEGGDYYGYAGLRMEFALSERMRFIPSFSVGYFESGHGHPPLGGPLEFHSTFRTDYALNDDLRLGAAYGHISNADKYKSNPGTNYVLLYLSLPLGSKR